MRCGGVPTPGQPTSPCSLLPECLVPSAYSPRLTFTLANSSALNNIDTRVGIINQGNDRAFESIRSSNSTYLIEPAWTADWPHVILSPRLALFSAMGWFVVCCDLTFSPRSSVSFILIRCLRTDIILAGRRLFTAALGRQGVFREVKAQNNANRGSFGICTATPEQKYPLRNRHNKTRQYKVSYSLSAGNVLLVALLG